MLSCPVFLFFLLGLHSTLVLSAAINRFPEVRQPIGALNFWRNPESRWPKGRIPYTISPSYTAKERRLIRSAMTEWESKTCIRFVPKEEDDKDYFEITPNDGLDSYCYCYVGKIGGKQIMKMYGECMRQAAMVHELGHVIGFNHEHQRPDRDDYITVHYEDIEPQYHSAFEEFTDDQVDNLGTKYDYASVMQYPYHAYMTTGNPSMTLKDGSIDKIRREARKLSSEDIRKVAVYYDNCN